MKANKVEKEILKGLGIILRNQKTILRNQTQLADAVIKNQVNIARYLTNNEIRGIKIKSLKNGK